MVLSLKSTKLTKNVAQNQTNFVDRNSCWLIVGITLGTWLCIGRGTIKTLEITLEIHLSMYKRDRDRISGHEVLDDSSEGTQSSGRKRHLRSREEESEYEMQSSLRADTEHRQKYERETVQLKKNK